MVHHASVAYASQSRPSFMYQSLASHVRSIRDSDAYIAWLPPTCEPDMRNESDDIEMHETPNMSSMPGYWSSPAAPTRAMPSRVDAAKPPTSYPPVPDSPGPGTQPTSTPVLSRSATRQSETAQQIPSSVGGVGSAQSPATPASAITPALQVRLGVFARLRRGIFELRGRTKLSLLVGAFMAFGQIVAFSIVLGITANEPCDRPLRTYLTLYIVKVGLAWPLSFYNTLAPRRCVTTCCVERHLADHQTTSGRPGRHEENTAEERARREARRALGNAALDARLRT